MSKKKNSKPSRLNDEVVIGEEVAVAEVTAAAATAAVVAIREQEVADAVAEVGDDDDADDHNSEADDIDDDDDYDAATATSRPAEIRGETGGGGGDGGSGGGEAATTTTTGTRGVGRPPLARLRHAVHAGPWLSSRRPRLSLDAHGEDPHSPSPSPSSPAKLRKGDDAKTSSPTSAVLAEEGRTTKKKGDVAPAHLEAWEVLPPVVTSEYVVLPQWRRQQQQQHQRQESKHWDAEPSGRRGGHCVLSVLSSRTSQHIATLVPPSPPSLLPPPAVEKQDDLVADLEGTGENNDGNSEEAENEVDNSSTTDEDTLKGPKDARMMGHDRRLELGQVVSAQALEVGSTTLSSSLLYVGTDTGVVCEYRLDKSDDDNASNDRERTGLRPGAAGTPPRRTLQLCWPPSPERSTSSHEDAVNEVNNNRNNDNRMGADDDGDDDAHNVDKDNSDDEMENAENETDEDAKGDPEASTHGAGEEAPSRKRKKQPPPPPSPQLPPERLGLRLHLVTFAAIRSQPGLSANLSDAVVVGYGLVSPVVDEVNNDEDFDVGDDEPLAGASMALPTAAAATGAELTSPHPDAKGNKRSKNMMNKKLAAPKPKPRQRVMLLIRFLVPPHESASPRFVTKVPVTVLDQWDMDKAPTSTKSPMPKPSSHAPMGSHVPFQLLSAVVPSMSRPGSTANVVLVAAPSGLTLYCDEPEAPLGGPSAPTSKRANRLSPSIVIQHPRRSFNLLTAVAVATGRPASSASACPVATAHWSGEIRVWLTLLHDAMTYLSRAKELHDGPNKKKTRHSIALPKIEHPMKSSPSIRLHWHAHPVSSVLFAPDDPSILYSGGEESVLCVWEWKRSVSVSNVLPRISAGPIVHVVAADVSSAGTAGSLDPGAGRRLILHTSDNVLHCILPHNLATAWKKIGIAAEPTRARMRLGVSSRTAEASGAHDYARPIVLVDRPSHSLLFAGLPRSPSAMQEWDGDHHCLVRSWPVAPHNRVSRQDWYDDEWAGPSVVCASFAPPGTLVTVDAVPTENRSIGRNGWVTTLKFWNRHSDRWNVSCAMSFPHGSLHDVSAVALSPNGRAAVSISNTEKAWRLWRKRTTSKTSADPDETTEQSPTVSEWQCEFRVEVPMGLSNYEVGRDAVSFSADSSVVAMAHGFLVSLWDPANMSLLGTLRHTSRDRFVTPHATSSTTSPDPAPVHTLQFASHRDMILTASEESVTLQVPDGGSWGRISPSDGWSHRPPPGHLVTSVAEAVRNRTQRNVAVASYCPSMDASAIELLDMVSGQILWIEPRWSGWIASLSSLSALPPGPRHDDFLPDEAGLPKSQDGPEEKTTTSVWDLVPSYTALTLTANGREQPSTDVEATSSSLEEFLPPPPFRLPSAPVQLWVLTGHGQLVSVVETCDDLFEDEVSPPTRRGGDSCPPSAGSGADDVPKIALFEGLRPGDTGRDAGSAPAPAVVMMDWRDLVVADNTDGGDIETLSSSSSPPTVLVPPPRAPMMISRRLGPGFVRSFVSNRGMVE